MMTPLIRQFKGRTYREIYWLLRKDKRLSEAMVEDKVAQLRAERADQTKQRAAARVQRAAWGELIEALQHERRIVRTMVRYKTAEPAPERDEFVNAYNEVLTKTYHRLTLLRRQGKMPEHTHWTDYVPATIKDTFLETLAEIPPRNRAKVKIPFERTDPFQLHDKRKGRLLRKTYTERTTASDNGDVDKAALLDEAVKRINALPPNAHVPNTWHGLFTKDELKSEA
jgi:hypothetical protein